LRRRHRKYRYRLYRRGGGYGSRGNRSGRLGGPGFHGNGIVYSNRSGRRSGSRLLFLGGRRFLLGYFYLRLFPNRFGFGLRFRFRRRRFLPGNNNRLRFRFRRGRRRLRGCRHFSITQNFNSYRRST
jgi:hypothetical protein